MQSEEAKQIITRAEVGLKRCGIATNDLLIAGRWVLLTLTLLVIAALAGSFVPLEQVVAKGHPWLPIKTCTGCLWCGMTRGFCAMTAGKFTEAWKLNHGAPFLYALFWLWTIAALARAVIFVRRRFFQSLIFPFSLHFLK